MERLPTRTSGSVAELSMWYDDLDDSEALLVITEHLFERGAGPNGVVDCLRTADIADGFGGVTDHDRVRGAFESLDDLQRLVLDDDLVPVRLELRDVIGAHTRTAVELVVDRTRQPSFHHPLSLVFDDASVYGMVGDPVRPLAGGLELVALMEGLADATPLSLGAIFNEYSIPAPADLEPRQAAFFRDFFVADDYVGLTAIGRIEVDATNAARRLEHGLLVVSTPQLGGSDQDVQDAAAHLIAAVTER